MPWGLSKPPTPTARDIPEDPGTKKKSKQSEVETAASDAAKDIADLTDATEAFVKKGLPEALLERRIDKLQKEKAEMEKRMAELLDADRKRKKRKQRLRSFQRSLSARVLALWFKSADRFVLLCCLVSVTIRVEIVIFCSQKAQAKVKTTTSPAP